MKQKCRHSLECRSVPEQAEKLKVADLAKHMSELRRLRERVRTAEIAARSLANDKAAFVKRSN